MIQKTGLTAIILTVAGVIPFAIADWFIWFPFQPAAVLGLEDGEAIINLWHLAILSMLIYGTGLFCFLCGARWGGTIASSRNYPSSITLILSVSAALIAAAALFLGVYGLMNGDPLNGGIGGQTPIGFYILAAGFVIILGFDALAGFPTGYLRARMVESLGGAISLAVSGWYVSAR